MLTTNFVNQQAIAVSDDGMKAVVRWIGSHMETAVVIVEKSDSGWVDEEGNLHCWHRRMWSTNVDRIMKEDWPRICAEPTYDEKRRMERERLANLCVESDVEDLPFV